MVQQLIHPSSFTFSTRHRRLRQSATVRNLISQVSLRPDQLIYPIFALDAASGREPIAAMPGIDRLGTREIIEIVNECRLMGIKTFAIFPVVPASCKDLTASCALDINFFYYPLISHLRDLFSDIVLMTDVALDPYTTHGHDGLVCEKTGRILNDETLAVLVQISLLQAKAGSHMIAPSDMMDGRIGLIRNELERASFHDTLIMSYAAKFASAFYGPFRDALHSAPKFGDKKTYQMDPRQPDWSLQDALSDEEQGADILMVKPGMPYLDILYRLSQSTRLPLAVYQVSGEYKMLYDLSAGQSLELEKIILESALAFKRAGAQILITYFAPLLGKLLQS